MSKSGLIKTAQQQKIMREAGKKLAQVMVELGEQSVMGMDTLSLDRLAEQRIFELGGTPVFKGYGDGDSDPFPATICASLNDEIVHGIPATDRILRDGDLLKIDIGMKYQGMIVDMARTFLVGTVSLEGKKLAAATEQSFWEGISAMKPHGNLSAYSKAVQKYVESNGFSVVRNLVGHGVGTELHEDPQIPNYWSRNCKNLELLPGMTLALEPMVNAGSFETKLGIDGWVFKTSDGKLSAHYENTILVTESGIDVLTMTE